MRIFSRRSTLLASLVSLAMLGCDDDASPDGSTSVQPGVITPSTEPDPSRPMPGNDVERNYGERNRDDDPGKTESDGLENEDVKEVEPGSATN